MKQNNSTELWGHSFTKFNVKMGPQIPQAPHPDSFLDWRGFSTGIMRHVGNICIILLYNIEGNRKKVFCGVGARKGIFRKSVFGIQKYLRNHASESIFEKNIN